MGREGIAATPLSLVAAIAAAHVYGGEGWNKNKVREKEKM